MAKQIIGENITAEMNGKVLTLTIDTSKRGEVSKSGKSVTIASTRGNKDLGNGVIAGINIYTPNR